MKKSIMLFTIALRTAVAGRQKEIQLHLLQGDSFKITSGESKK